MVVRGRRNASGAGQGVDVSTLGRAQTINKLMMRSRSLHHQSLREEGGVREERLVLQEVVMESSNVGRTRLGWTIRGSG